MAHSRHTITHVIFDLNETLVNTSKVIQQISEDVANKLNKQLPSEFEEKIKDIYCVRKLSDLSDELERSLNVDSNQILAILYKSIAKTRQEIALMPGAERLVSHLAKHGIPLGIATAESRHNYDYMTDCFGALLKPGGAISHVVCGEDDSEVVNNKPAPDIYLVCAKRFSPPPACLANVLIVDDRSDCVERAIAVGMTGLLISPKSDRNQCESIIALQSLEDFRPQLFGLPAFSLL